MKTRTAWIIWTVLFVTVWAGYQTPLFADNEIPWWAVACLAAVVAAFFLLVFQKLADVENEPLSGRTFLPRLPRPVPTERPKEPPAEPTICAGCKHVWDGCGERDDYLCKVDEMNLERRVDVVTGEVYYTKAVSESGGPPLRRFGGPFPQCAIVNTGNCPHFEAKEDDHGT